MSESRLLRNVLVTCFLMLASNLSQAAYFIVLNPPPGGTEVQATSISGDGRVVVGYVMYGSVSTEAFYWTANGGMESLGDLPGGRFSSYAWGVSEDGSVIVGNATTDVGPEAFRWTSPDGMIGLGYLSTTNDDNPRSHASSVSADGNVVVGFSDPGVTPPQRNEAFRWTMGEGMVGLGAIVPGADTSNALGVSGDGLVIVGQGKTGLGNEAFRWTSSSGMVPLGDFSGQQYTSQQASAASMDGSVIVGHKYVPHHDEAFRWTVNEGMVLIGSLDSSNGTQAFDVSADGSVIVGRAVENYRPVGFIWDEDNGLRNLKELLISDYGFDDLTYWTSFEAKGISDDGLTIVGKGRKYIDGAERRLSWVANLSSATAPPMIDVSINVLDGTEQECASHDGTVVSLVTEIDTPDLNNISSIAWTIDGEHYAYGDSIDPVLSLGDHTITVVVELSTTETDTDTVDVKVIDTQSPDVFAAFVDVKTGQEVTQVTSRDKVFPIVVSNDTCDPEPSITAIVGVTAENDDVFSFDKSRKALHVKSTSDEDDAVLSVISIDESGNIATDKVELRILQ